jgi:hypothetical protein
VEVRGRFEEKGFNTEVTEGGTPFEAQGKQRGTERKRTDYVSAARRKDNAETLRVLRFAEKKVRGNLRGRAETESAGGNSKSNSSVARELRELRRKRKGARDGPRPLQLKVHWALRTPGVEAWKAVSYGGGCK